MVVGEEEEDWMSEKAEYNDKTFETEEEEKLINNI